ncbi:ABC transporter substrate-binding protein [Bradyrhizobium sp. STM 3843]|uniref:ABC transporter substrate-binding protein n=1 Tax=Bradyrhizobium sp. STM 3843 TaxID=551947 RepID=UPI0002E48A45|nr:ABC transporter substrate-binding protein [Bradyrhizobium sp. STM 3843]
MIFRSSVLLVAALLAGPASAAGTNADVVRNLASRVGPIVGAASACQAIDQGRVQAIVDKFREVIREASAGASDRDELTRVFNGFVADGRNRVGASQTDCTTAGRQLAELERSLGQAAPSTSSSGFGGVIGSTPAAAATAPTATLPPTLASNVQGVTANEIRFGICGPFSGASRELGRQMKLGIDAAFNRTNDAGGIAGRSLRLFAADDGYEPSRTLEAMRQLYEKDKVFGFIGNVGTPTAAVGMPYALQHRALFYGAFTGANLLRNDPPDRYVFNYRASYAEETNEVVHYLLKLRRLQPRDIAVFAQQDAYGDAGFAGVSKAFRSLGLPDSAIVRFNYKRNTVDVDEAVNQLRAMKNPPKAIVMVATYRAAAKFIEKTRDQYPSMVYTNVSFVGSTELSDELMLLGPRYASGVIVTQVVPAVGGYSSAVLEYKSALEKYFPGEAPSYVSFEGYVAANVLIQALKRVGPQLDTEALIDTLENTNNVDLGLGAKLGFGRAEHQASHKIWGTALDERGKYQAIELE